MSQQEKLDQLEALGKIAIRAAEVVDAVRTIKVVELARLGGDLLAATDDLGALLDAYNSRFGEPEAAVTENDDSKAMTENDDSKAIIVYGNPVTGLAFEGPFDTWAEAEAHLPNVENTAWVAEMHPALTVEPEIGWHRRMALELIRAEREAQRDG